MRGHVPSGPAEAPLAIIETGCVHACEAQAEALGVHPGMTLASAWVRVPHLRVLARRPDEERAALEGIAAWMCRFTPRVSLEPVQGILAEVAGSLRLFGGLGALAARIREGLLELGVSARLAAAPYPGAAWCLARAGHEQLIGSETGLEAALDRVPAQVLCETPEARRLIDALGLSTVGALRALPRAALAHRLGHGPVERLDRAFGRVPDPRRFFSPPPRFSASLELPSEVTHAEGVLFASRRLLVQLEGLLIAHQAGVHRFDLVLFHSRGQAERIPVRLGTPGRDAARFLQLLRERLASSALAAPVRAIRIRARGFVPFAGVATGLFRDGRVEAEAWGQLVERLQARLGAHAVHGLETREDHRPEQAWRRLRPGQASARSAGAPAPGPRPLWLLEPPRRLEEIGGVPHEGAYGPLELLAGPERIEAGWWDGADVTRDYFIARTRDAALYWIFRHPGGGWHLHGLFA